MSTCTRPQGLPPTSLLCPRDSPGKDRGVGCQFQLWVLFPTSAEQPSESTAGPFLQKNLLANTSVQAAPPKGLCYFNFHWKVSGLWDDFSLGQLSVWHGPCGARGAEVGTADGRCSGGKAVTVAGGDVDSGRSLSCPPLSVWPGRSEIQESKDPKPLDIEKGKLSRVEISLNSPMWSALEEGQHPGHSPGALSHLAVVADARAAVVGASFSCWVEAEASVCLLKIFSSLGPCVESPLSI